MAPTPIIVRGKRKRPLFSKTTSSSASPAPPRVRRRLKPRPTPFDSRLPFEILERIFLLSENVNLARASPLLGLRLSNRRTLVELVIAAFGTTWNNGVRQIADDNSNPAFQSAVIACPWAKTALLLDAQQLWLRRHSPARYSHVLVNQETWACMTAATHNRSQLQALMRSHEEWGGCQGAELAAVVPLSVLSPVPICSIAEIGPAPASVAAPWSHNVHSCFNLEEVAFIYKTCPELLQWQPLPALKTSVNDDPFFPSFYALESIAPSRRRPRCTPKSIARVDVNWLTRIPEHLLLAGGPYDSGGSEAATRQRLRDVFDKLFWLAEGGARLQAADSWEVTHHGIKHLMQIDMAAQQKEDDDVKEGRAREECLNSYSGDRSAATAARLSYSTDVLVASVIGLFHSLGVFSKQWPTLVVEEAVRGVRARAARDGRFRQSITCSCLHRVLQMELPDSGLLI